MLTLVQYARDMEAGPAQSMVSVFAERHPLWNIMPIETEPSGLWQYDREQTLGDVGFRAINEGFAETTATTDRLFEKVAIVGGDAKVDEALIERSGEAIVNRQHIMKVKAMSWAAGDAIMNGNSLTNTKSYDGLKRRLDYSRTTSGQIISEGSTDGGDPLQASSMDILVSSVSGGTNALVMTRAMLNIITAGSRNPAVMGYVMFDPGSLGNPIPSWNGIPIIVIDPPNAKTASMGFNELGGSGNTATATSIYAVSFRIGGTFGFQVAPMKWNPNVSDGSIFRIGRLSWQLGLVIEDIYSIARLRNIANAPMIA